MLYCISFFDGIDLIHEWIRDCFDSWMINFEIVACLKYMIWYHIIPVWGDVAFLSHTRDSKNWADWLKRWANAHPPKIIWSFSRRIAFGNLFFFWFSFIFLKRGFIHDWRKLLLLLWCPSAQSLFIYYLFIHSMHNLRLVRICYVFILGTQCTHPLFIFHQE